MKMKDYILKVSYNLKNGDNVDNLLKTKRVKVPQSQENRVIHGVIHIIHSEKCRILNHNKSLEDLPVICYNHKHR